MIDKILGMNFGTRSRVLATMITDILNALVIFNIIHFNNEQIDTIAKAIAIIILIIVNAIGIYFNNDFTEEACEGTGYMRYLKAMQKGQADVWTELGNEEEVVEDEDESIDEDVNIESSTESVEVIDDEENYEVTEDEEEGTDEEIEEDEEIKEGEK